MIIGNRKFDTENNFYVMGIVNFTPDSFSDGGQYNDIDKALFRIEQMIKDGADIIDIGGESTRPNHIKISDDEEIERISPILSAVRARFSIPISLDTYKGNVASAVVPYIDMVNDIWGLKYDNNMASIIAQNKLSCCIMHNKNNSEYNDFWSELKSDITSSLEIAKNANIPQDKIMIDAGVGFAKSYEQNLISINRTDDFKNFGLPILIATSNKSVIGLTNDCPVTDRVSGTVATSVVGAMKGASFFRVHDVKANRQALDMVHAIINERKV